MIPGLRFLVQICQELGQPYEEYNAQLMRLKRQEEANEDNGFHFRSAGEDNGYMQQQAYQPQAAYYPSNGQDEEPSNNNNNGYHQPPSNRPAPQMNGGNKPPADNQEDEGWGKEDLSSRLIVWFDCRGLLI